MFYDKLCAICKERNMKPTNVLIELGMSQGNLSRWKSGTEPRESVLQKFATYFNVPKSYFFSDDEAEDLLQDIIDTVQSWFEEYDIEFYSYDDDNGVGEEYVLSHNGKSQNLQQWEFHSLCKSLYEHSKSASDLVMQDFINQYFKENVIDSLNEDELDLLTAFRSLKGMQKHKIVHYCLSAMEENSRQDGRVSN